MSVVAPLLILAGIMLLIGIVAIGVDWMNRTAQRKAYDRWLDSEVRMIEGRPDDNDG